MQILINMEIKFEVIKSLLLGLFILQTLLLVFTHASTTETIPEGGMVSVELIPLIVEDHLLLREAMHRIILLIIVLNRFWLIIFLLVVGVLTWPLYHVLLLLFLVI